MGFVFSPVCGCVKFAADSLPNVLPVVHHTMPPTPSDWPYASEPAALAPGTNIDQAKEPERTQKPLNLNGPSTAGIWNAPEAKDSWKLHSEGTKIPPMMIRIGEPYG